MHTEQIGSSRPTDKWPRDVVLDVESAYRHGISQGLTPVAAMEEALDEANKYVEWIIEVAFKRKMKDLAASDMPSNLDYEFINNRLIAKLAVKQSQLDSAIFFENSPDIPSDSAANKYMTQMIKIYSDEIAFFRAIIAQRQKMENEINELRKSAK